MLFSILLYAVGTATSTRLPNQSRHLRPREGTLPSRGFFIAARFKPDFQESPTSILSPLRPAVLPVLQ